MSSKIRVAILDDHQSIIDGYIYRLGQIPEIEVVATATFGDELEPMLAAHSLEVLLLDVQVATAPDNLNPYPILHLIPKLVEKYPDLNVLVISMHNQPTLIKAVMEAGASGYILKDDQATIVELGNIIRTVAKGAIYFSQQASQQLFRKIPGDSTLTIRQIEVLSLCAAYPNATTAELANRLGVANSTIRNLLSGAYIRLDVRNRAAAIAKVQKLGLIASPPRSPEW